MSTALALGDATFALLDVKADRVPLAELVQDHKHKVPIVLRGFITGQWSGDDGTSREFEIDVTSVETAEAVPHACGCLRCNPVPVVPKKGISGFAAPRWGHDD